MFKPANIINKPLSVCVMMGFFLIFLPYSIVHNLSYHYVLVGIAFLTVGIINPFGGLLFSYTIMNYMFDLLPHEINYAFPVTKIWDLGFFFMIIISLPLFYKDFVAYGKWPGFLKILCFFFIICAISFFYTLIIYKYPFADSFRVLRRYFGYFGIVIFLQFFLKNENNIKQFFHVLYFLTFCLLILYHVQIIFQIPIFFGYQGTIGYGGISIIRSIPIFINLSCLFFWYNLAAWLSGKPLLKLGHFYNLLTFNAVLFTFTRGLYIAVFICLFLLLGLLFFQKKASLSRIFLSVLLLVNFIFFASFSSFFQPIMIRALSTQKTLFSKNNEGTFQYRLKILESRLEMINKRNPFLGIGFVHSKYGKDFGTFTGNPLKYISGPSLWSADISWANIIYQTGYLGSATFILFIIFLVKSYPKLLIKIKLDFFDLLELAAYVGLIQYIILMFNGSAFTNDSQNPSLLIAILLYIGTTKKTTGIANYLSDDR